MSIVQHVESELNSQSDRVEIKNPPKLPRVCPNCQGRLIGWGGYWREVTSPEMLSNVFKIRIRRVRCKGCGVTHAVLPHFLAPYQRFVTPIRQQVVDKWVWGPRCSVWPGRSVVVWTRCVAG